MPEQDDYGPHLSDEEYDRQIVVLYDKLPPTPSREQEREVRRTELNLAIDHRLGRDFPIQKREALWEVQQRVEKKRVWLMLKYFVKKLLRRSIAQEAQGLAQYLVDEYAKVLTPSELERFFGKAEARSPALPFDARETGGRPSSRV